jgi:hypothetical protein
MRQERVQLASRWCGFGIFALEGEMWGAATGLLSNGWDLYPSCQLQLAFSGRHGPRLCQHKRPFVVAEAQRCERQVQRLSKQGHSDGVGRVRERSPEPLEIERLGALHEPAAA